MLQRVQEIQLVRVESATRSIAVRCGLALRVPAQRNGTSIVQLGTRSIDHGARHVCRGEGEPRIIVRRSTLSLRYRS